MRGKACSAEFMRRLEKMVQARNGESRKDLMKALRGQTCLGSSQLYDLLRVLDLEKQISGYPEKPHPSILSESLGAPDPVALATQAIEEGWTSPQVRLEAKRLKRIERIKTAPPSPEWTGQYATNALYVASLDAITLPESSVTLLLSDPPWDEGGLALYEQIAHMASTCLVPGGFCGVYAGKMFLPQILNACGRWLEYVWTFAVVQFDNNSKISKWNLFEAWRPIVLFRKEGPRKETCWCPDAIRCTRDKSRHEWQQGIEPARMLIEALTQPNELVLDPCVGGGTIPLAAQQAGRSYLGFDRDEYAVRVSLERLQDERRTKISE